MGRRMKRGWGETLHTPPLLLALVIVLRRKTEIAFARSSSNMIPEGLLRYFDVNSIRVGILFAKIKVDGEKAFNSGSRKLLVICMVQ